MPHEEKERKKSYCNLYIYIVMDLETISIQHTDVPKVSYVIKYVCSRIPCLLYMGVSKACVQFILS